MNCWSFEVLAARGRSSGAMRRLEVLLNIRKRTVITRTPRTIPQPTTIQLAAWRRRSFTVVFSICDQRRRRNHRQGRESGLEVCIGDDGGFYNFHSPRNRLAY